MAMPDLQRYPWNLNLIKYVKDNVVFLTRKVFISTIISIDSYKQGMHIAQVTVAETPQMKINMLKKQHEYIINTWSE